MTDLDQIALDTVEAIANIDPDKLKGGRLQALAQAQCLVRDALQELEEVGAENYTLMQELDAALDQVIYWRERAVGAEGERDALAAHLESYMGSLSRTIEAWKKEANEGDGIMQEHEGVMREAHRLLSLVQQPRGSLARLKAKWQAEVLYEFTHGSYVMPATLNLAMCKRANELRRQAEEDA